MLQGDEDDNIKVRDKQDVSNLKELEKEDQYILREELKRALKEL